MKAILLAGTILAAISPAMASNVAITMWTDGSDAETAIGTGVAALTTSNLDGVTITASSSKRTTSPNDLTVSNFNIDNTTDAFQTLIVVGGANGFLGNSTLFKLTGTIGVTTGSAELVGSFFTDNSNSLNGQSTGPIAGTDIRDFDSGLLGNTDSFALPLNTFALGSVTGPYGFAERMTLTLAPGADIFVQGVSIEAANAVPEPKTWVLSLLGFGLLGMVGLRRRTIAERFAL